MTLFFHNVARIAKNEAAKATLTNLNYRRPYSTVTDLARFLGWSTSHPLRIAMW
jgi:hypothetical protein